MIDQALALTQDEIQGLIAGTVRTIVRPVVPTMTEPKIGPLTMQPWLVGDEQETDEDGAPCWIGHHPNYPTPFGKWFSPDYKAGDVIWCYDTCPVEVISVKVEMRRSGWYWIYEVERV